MSLGNVSHAPQEEKAEALKAAAAPARLPRGARAHHAGLTRSDPGRPRRQASRGRVPLDEAGARAG